MSSYFTCNNRLNNLNDQIHASPPQTQTLALKALQCFSAWDGRFQLLIIYRLLFDTEMVLKSVIKYYYISQPHYWHGSKAAA